MLYCCCPARSVCCSPSPTHRLLELCRYLNEKLQADDVNTRHRTLLIIEACSDIPKAVFFRKHLRMHCIGAVSHSRLTMIIRIHNLRYGSAW